MACKSCNSSKKTTTSSNKRTRTSSNNKSSSTANCVGADCYESRYKRPSQFVGRRRSKIDEDKCCDDINLDNRYVDWMWHDFICEELDIPPPPDYPLPELPPVCTIDSIELGNQGDCITGIDTYYQDLVIRYTSAPSTGTLVVNGQNFSITGSPQNVRLANLPADNNSVDVSAFFSARPLCRVQNNALFTAPAACSPPPPDPILPDPPPPPQVPDRCAYGGQTLTVNRASVFTNTGYPTPQLDGFVEPLGTPRRDTAFDMYIPRDIGVTEAYVYIGEISPAATSITKFGNQPPPLYASFVSYSRTSSNAAQQNYIIPAGQNTLFHIKFNPNLASGIVGATSYDNSLLRLFMWYNIGSNSPEAASFEVNGGGSNQNICREQNPIIYNNIISTYSPTIVNLDLTNYTFIR